MIGVRLDPQMEADLATISVQSGMTYADVIRLGLQRLKEQIEREGGVHLPITFEANKKATAPLAAVSAKPSHEAVASTASGAGGRSRPTRKGKTV